VSAVVGGAKIFEGIFEKRVTIRTVVVQLPAFCDVWACGRGFAGIYHDPDWAHGPHSSHNHKRSAV